MMASAVEVEPVGGGRVSVAPLTASEARRMLNGISADMMGLARRGARISSCCACARLLLREDAHACRHKGGLAALCGPCADSGLHGHAEFGGVCPGCPAQARDPSIRAAPGGGP